MNKAAKGAIAASAAGILLVGGAGTFALWSDDVVVDAGTVSTGQLRLLADPTGVWKSGETDITANIGTYEIVPGDTITYTTEVSITATGDNLTGVLAIDEASFDTAFGNLAADDVDAVVSHDAITGPGITVVGNEMTFTEADEAHTFNVTITIDFPGTTTGLTDQDLTLVLPALAVSLDQI